MANTDTQARREHWSDSFDQVGNVWSDYQELARKRDAGETLSADEVTSLEKWEREQGRVPSTVGRDL